jgi:hypothetical protein
MRTFSSEAQRGSGVTVEHQSVIAAGPPVAIVVANADHDGTDWHEPVTDDACSSARPDGDIRENN